MRRTALALSLLLLPALAAAQQGAAPKTTDARTLGWQVRSDNDADIAKLVFVEMKPGWHITTGSVAGIFYRPDMTGVGAYEATFKAYLFGPQPAHAEAYGLFVGGKDLPGAGQQYLYFLIRNDGKYLIKTRSGTVTKDVVPWSPAASIKTLAPNDSGTVLNTLKIDATPTVVHFLVNDVVVASKPRAEVAVDGVVGLRVNHLLNLHVTDLSVIKGK